MKKLLSLVLCMALMCSCITWGVSASDAPTVNIYGVSNGSIIDQGDSVKVLVEVSEASEETTLYLDDEALANAADNVYTINNINNGRHILKAKAVINGTEYYSDDVVFYVAFGRQTYGDFEATFENTFNFTNSNTAGYRGSANVFAQTPTNPKGLSYKISNAKNGMLIFDDFNSSTLHTAERVWEFDMYVDDVTNDDFETYFYVGGFDSSFKGYLLRKGANGSTVFKGADGKEYPCTEETWYRVTVKYNYPQGRVELFADVYGDGVPVSLGIYTFPKISGIPSSIRMVTNGTAYSVYFDNSTCKETHYSPYVKSIKFYANGTEYTEDTIPANPDKIVLVLNEKKLSASDKDFTVTVSDGTNTITPAISDKTTENNTITLNFRTPLKQSTTYTITISSGLSSYKWAYGTTSQSYKFTTLFDFNLYGISDYSRLNGDATTKLTAVSGQKGDISLYVDGKRYAVQNDVTEAVFELKDLVYGEHKLYAKVEDYGLMTPELTFYNYNEAKTELASNREFTSTEENTRFGDWGAKLGTIATPGKTDEKSYILMKKGSKDGAQIITTVGRTGDANLFNEERVLDFDLYIDEVGDNNMDLHIYSDKCYRVSSIILPSDTGDKSVFKGPDGKEYPIIEDNWYHVSAKFNFARGTIETFVDVYGDGNPVSLGRNTFSANAGSETLYIYANIFGKNDGASEAYIDNVMISSINYIYNENFEITDYIIKKGSEVINPDAIVAGDEVSFEISFKNKSSDIKSGKVYFVAYKSNELVYVNVQNLNLKPGVSSVTISSNESYIASEKPDKVRVLVWDENCVPYFVSE